MNVKAAYTVYVTKVVIVNVYVSRLTNTPIIIIIDRNVFNLNNSTKLIVLYIAVIIITRVKTNTYVWRPNIYT